MKIAIPVVATLFNSVVSWQGSHGSPEVRMKGDLYET
jgi:hypothetical protein